MQELQTMTTPTELPTLKLLCPPMQYKGILEGIAEGGEATAAFWDRKENEIAAIWRFMPGPYQTESENRNAIARLHFFRGSADWWIIEKDSGPGQNQMFGIADLGLGCREYGYISLQEIHSVNAELDLYWEPKTARELLNR
jgi:hypothetical protein